MILTFSRKLAKFSTFHVNSSHLDISLKCLQSIQPNARKIWLSPTPVKSNATALMWLHDSIPHHQYKAKMDRTYEQLSSAEMLFCGSAWWILAKLNNKANKCGFQCIYKHLFIFSDTNVLVNNGPIESLKNYYQT